MLSTDIVLVAISGPSSSGKTTVSRSLYQLFRNCKVVHQDDFYVSDDKIPIDPATGEQTWDEPGAVDFVRFKEYLRTVKAGSETESMRSYELDSDLVLSEAEIATLKSNFQHIVDTDKLVVLVDGFMLYYDEEISKLFDVKLFYHAAYETLKARREARVGYSTVAGFWVDPPNYFDDYVWPAYVKYHKTLFENNNVNGELNDFAKQELQIKNCKNENGVELTKLVTWALEAIDAHSLL